MKLSLFSCLLLLLLSSYKLQLDWKGGDVVVLAGLAVCSYYNCMAVIVVIELACYLL